MQGRDAPRQLRVRRAFGRLGGSPRRLLTRLAYRLDDFAWLWSRGQRAVRFQRSRRYWVFRKRWATLGFKFYARLVSWRRALRERRAEAHAGRLITQTAVVSVLVSILCFALIEALDRLLLQDSSVLRTLLPDQAVPHITERFARPAPGALSVFGTVAQIAGVFLALYFTAVSAIVASVYANVPGDVRLLLTREKLGSVYVWLVAFTGAYALILSTAVLLGVRVGLLNVAVIGLLSAISVFAFVKLGVRTFNFFSPDLLAGYVIAEVVPLIESSRRGRFASRTPAIPYNYQRWAESHLETLRSIIQLSASRPSVTERSLLQMVESCLYLSYFYGSRKSDIPRDSLWFKRRVEHPRWLTADHTSVDLAVRSQTAIQPKEVADRLWFEREVNGSLRSLLGALLDRPERAGAAEAFTHVVSWVREYGEQLAVDETLALEQLVSDLLDAHLGNRPTKDSALETLALADVRSSLAMQIVLGMSDRLRVLTAESFTAATTSVDPVGRLDGSWPVEVIDQREYLAERLRNERDVEGRRLTPEWYVAQIMALAMSRFFARSVPLLIAELEELPVVAESHLRSDRPLVAAAVIARALEACHKFAVHLTEFEHCLERVATLRRASDIPWVDTDWSDAQTQVKEVRTRLLVLIAGASLELSRQPTGGEIPDYFGNAYTVLAEESLRTMLHDDIETFRRLFPALFMTSLNAHERLRMELKDHDETARLLFSTETLEDLLDISGYAAILNDVGRSEPWTTVKEVWDKYLGGREDRESFFTFLFAILGFRGAQFGIKPRDITRTAWGQEFRRALVADGLLADDMYGGLYDDEDEDPSRGGDLFRTATAGLGFDRAGEAFIAGYLLEWPEAQGIDLPRQTEMFLESLEHRRRRAAERREERPQPPVNDPGQVPMSEDPAKSEREDDGVAGGET
jgi:hypothetical protein